MCKQVEKVESEILLVNQLLTITDTEYPTAYDMSGPIKYVNHYKRATMIKLEGMIRDKMSTTPGCGGSLRA